MIRLKEDHGAACDGVTIDDVPMANALADWGANGGDLVIEGTPLLTRAFAQSLDQPSRLVGGGEITWDCDSPGLHLTQTTIDRFTAEGVAFTTNRLAAGTAFRLTCPVIPSGTHQGPSLRHLTFKGMDTAQHCWLKGALVENAWNARILDTSTKGQDDAQPPFNQTVAIELANCMAPELRGNNVYHCQTGLTTSGDRTEGLNISGGEMVGVNRGIVLPYATNFSAGTAIGRLHINAYSRCIVIEHGAQIHLHDMLLYKTHVSGQYWQGVEINASDSIVCHHISLRGTEQTIGGNDCITFVNSTRCRMTECDAGDFGSQGAMAILAGTSANCRLVSKSQERGVNIGAPVNWATGGGNVLEVT